MTQVSYNLKDLLHHWGQKERILPIGNEAMKARIFAALRTQNTVQPERRRFRYPWRIAFVCGGLSILFFVTQGFYLNRLTSADHGLNPAGYGYDAASKVGYQRSSSGEISANDLGVVYGAYTGLSAREVTAGGIVGEIVGGAAKSIGRYFTQASPFDTREYLKTDYHAEIKTRQVQKKATRAQTIVRGHGGRVDNSSSDSKYARIEFVLPKSEMESFKDELKELAASPRFMAEIINSRNLLPEKTVIEQNTASSQSALADSQKQRQDLVVSHNTKVASLKQQLSYTANSINKLKKEFTTSTERQQEIAVAVSNLSTEQRRLNQLLANENAQYQKKRNEIDARIKNEQEQLVFLDQQDRQLINNVETVQGSISIEWISGWGVLALYVPYYRTFIFIAIIALIIYLLYGRRRRFELV
ncbi:hypothetical protein EPN28_02685 [Patescibacteria group bacterium]|nr:MAG: hypothetical protein EPN28_02685 [Patescibacteria group bacterium]